MSFWLRPNWSAYCEGVEPLVIVGRSAVLLLRKKQVQSFLLRRRRDRHQSDGGESEGRINRPPIIFRLRLRMQTLLQRNRASGIDGTSDAVCCYGMTQGGKDEGNDKYRRKSAQQSLTSIGHKRSQRRSISRFYRYLYTVYSLSDRGCLRRVVSRKQTCSPIRESTTIAGWRSVRITEDHQFRTGPAPKPENSGCFWLRPSSVCLNHRRGR